MQSPPTVSRRSFDCTNDILGSPVTGRGPVTPPSFAAFLSRMSLFDFWSTTLHPVDLIGMATASIFYTSPGLHTTILGFNCATPSEDGPWQKFTPTTMNVIPTSCKYWLTISLIFRAGFTSFLVLFIRTGSAHIFRLDQPCSVDERRVFIFHAAWKTYPCVQLGRQDRLFWQ